MNSNNIQEKLEEGIKIKELLYLCIANWKWFALSVVCCLAIAVLYIKTTPPTYVRTASVLIKDEDNSQLNFMQNYLPFKNNENVNNEIISIQAIPQMMGVVERLGLNTNYILEGRFHDHVLYGNNLPIKATIVTPKENAYASFTLHFLEDGKMELSEFVLGIDEFEKQTVMASLSETVKTPIGDVTIEPTKFFTDSIEAPIFVSKSSVMATAKAYASRLGAGLHEKESTVIDLSFSDVSPQRAEDVLNTLIEVYNENWVNDRNLVAKSTSEFIKKRLEVVEGELEQVEYEISAYKSKTLMPDVKRVSEIYLSKSEATEKELTKLYTTREIAKFLLEYMQENNSKEQLLPANSGIESPGIESQIKSYNDMVIRRGTLIAGSSESNPLVIDLDTALDATHKAIVTSVKNYIISLDKQVARLEKEEEKTNSQLAESPNQAKYLLSVERQQKVKEQLYVFLLQKYEENELTQAFTAYNTRIIQPAMGSNAPSAPAKSKILLVAFALGFLLPAGVIFLSENMNSRVRTREDLKDITIPFLGEIPYSIHKKERGLLKKLLRFGKKEKEDYSTIIVRDRKRSFINESFRILRTNLEFLVGKDKGSQVVLLTSYIAGSGKTFLSVNLGSSIAIKGKRVVVLDGDLRRGCASRYIDSPSVGFTDYLCGEVKNIADITYPVEGIDGYDIIPVGTVPPNPSELLENGKLEDFIAKLRETYDYIIIDCPPMGLIADAMVFERYTDCTLFVVRSGLFEREMLGDLETIYNEKKFKNLSIILNATRPIGGKYGYGYSSKYGYGGKYGYGHYYGSSKG